MRYKDVAENAFYCNAGKFVAYDDENLFPQLEKNFDGSHGVLGTRGLLTRVGVG